MQIYQMHPNHGRHIAGDHNEEKRNIESGWATVTEDEFYKEIRQRNVVATQEYTLSRDELVKLYELKFNKKPHHKMKAESIQTKLDE